MLPEYSLPSQKMVPWYLVTILCGEHGLYEQNLSSVQPWLLRNMEFGSSQVMHRKQRQPADKHVSPQSKLINLKKKNAFLFLHPWILTVVPACATHGQSTTSATCHGGLESSLIDVGHASCRAFRQSGLLIIDADHFEIIWLQQAVLNSLFDVFDGNWGKNKII